MDEITNIQGYIWFGFSNVFVENNVTWNVEYKILNSDSPEQEYSTLSIVRNVTSGKTYCYIKANSLNLYSISENGQSYLEGDIPYPFYLEYLDNGLIFPRNILMLDFGTDSSTGKDNIQLIRWLTRNGILVKSNEKIEPVPSIEIEKIVSGDTASDFRLKINKALSNTDDSDPENPPISVEYQINKMLGPTGKEEENPTKDGTINKVIEELNSAVIYAIIAKNAQYEARVASESSKIYSEYSSQSAEDSADSANASANSALESKGYADDSKGYSEDSQRYADDSEVSSVQAGIYKTQTEDLIGAVQSGESVDEFILYQGYYYDSQFYADPQHQILPSKNHVIYKDIPSGKLYIKKQNAFVPFTASLPVQEEEPTDQAEGDLWFQIVTY